MITKNVKIIIVPFFFFCSYVGIPHEKNAYLYQIPAYSNRCWYCADSDHDDNKRRQRTFLDTEFKKSKH